MLGTADYVAPEQTRDSHNVDARADIYGLGGTLFWCLAGQLPFAPQSSIDQDLITRLTQPAPSVCACRPDVPAELDEVVRRMMAPDPADRYPTPQSLMRGLSRFFQQARAGKNWGRSDELRDQLAALGWAIKDGKDGAKLTRKI